MKKLVEFIPNFSLSSQKDPKGYEALCEVAENIKDCIVLDFQSDGSHNRSDLTMIGTIEGIEMLLGMFGLKSKKWVERLADNCLNENITYDYEIDEYSSFTNRIEEKWDAVHQMKEHFIIK